MIIRPVVKPADLAGVDNGELPASMLVQVGPGGTVGQLHHLAARAWLAMVAAAAHDAIYLAYSGCYRSYSQQVALFLGRYIPESDWAAKRHLIAWSGSVPKQVKVWRGQRWAKRLGVATAAVPGTSNHGWGLAIDAGIDRDPSDAFDDYNENTSLTAAALAWLDRHAPDFGFSWETLPEEPWHIRYVTGNDVPLAVLAYEASQWPTQPPVDPPSPIVHQEDTMRVLIAPGTTALGLAGRELVHIKSGHTAEALGTTPITREGLKGLLTEPSISVVGDMPPEWANHGDDELAWLWIANADR